ncbi:MAG: nucleoside triphosphate pyrophosphohydrolase family protein [Methylovulum sp.]|nr:nucleoside triphosphate pyrophosphohydrolase family protein [Methylovulum sp.]
MTDIDKDQSAAMAQSKRIKRGRAYAESDEFGDYVSRMLEANPEMTITVLRKRFWSQHFLPGCHDKGVIEMNNMNEYQSAAMRTAKRINLEYDLNHAALGLAGEAGEFADCIKRHTIYGKPLDKINAVEEIGDLLWFCALACETLGVTLSQAAEQNLYKLSLRYPDMYTDELAAQRLDKSEAR